MNLGQGGRESRGAIHSGLAEEVEEEVATMQRVRSAGGEVRRSGGDAEATVKSVAASRRWQHPLSRSVRVREWSVGRLVAQGNLVPCALAPTYLLWCCATGAHQPWSGWAPPIRARIQVPNWPRSIQHSPL